MERLLKYFKPEKYLLDLLIDKNKKTIGGEVTVCGEALSETVKFHAVGLKVTDVLVNDKKVEFKADGKVLEIEDVSLGENEIKIVYHGKLNENMQGAYLSTYEYKGKTETIVATQFESHYAREAFPCIDEPAAKAVFELKISVPEKDDLILTNVPMGEPTPRMSTYLLAWVIGKFHGHTVKNEHGVEITTYCALNQDVNSVDFANEIAARSLEFYDDNFGLPYPLKKLDQVALPDFEAGAMENWGLVTYRESMMLASPDATLGTKKSVALTVSHELSHQWFGDLVTMKWWDDLWLNESFATVMEYYATDYIHPEYKIFESFFTSDCYAALLRDAYKGVQSVHQDVKSPEEIATLFDGAIVYAKGARLMLMLIRLMGWENFCKGIRDYFEKYKYQNTVGDDLWKALEPYAEFNPSELMHAFIDKPGYPIITSEAYDFRKFSQKRFLLDGPCEKDEWPIPRVTEDMSGHYILNLKETEFNERLKDFDKLGLEEKLRLLIDRDLITKAGMQSAAFLVPLLMRFKFEDQAAVWNKVAGLVGNLMVYVDDGSPEEKKLKQYTLKLVDAKLAEIGLATKKDDDENVIRLRANLMALDYYAEDKERFKKLATWYDKDYRKMDAEIRDDILSAKIYLEPKMVDEYLEKYQTIADPDVRFDYLLAATLVRDKRELDKVLRLLNDTEVVKPQDQLHLFVCLYKNPKSRKKAFDWMVKNWEMIKEAGGEKTLGDYPMVIGKLARTEEEFDKYYKFFEPLKDDPTLMRAVEIGKNEIKARIKLIQKNQKGVTEALQK
ncbi:M1 family metallopeptidase [Candidatus Saccharibacteria bacterium]|nr:M1 family metallopeptidase [Candidatus Saccharibacteria bacterium]